MIELVKKVGPHLENILVKNIGLKTEDLGKEEFVIIYDRESLLSRILFAAYNELLPRAVLVDYYAFEIDELKKMIGDWPKNWTVILIQSSSFRVSNFRWRLELFNLGFKVVEHAHLGVNLDKEAENYVDSLEYRGEFYREMGLGLKEKLEKAKIVKLIGKSGEELVYEGGMEECKLNIGDFSGKKNVGCAFPIGEVFSEAKVLEKLNGETSIFAFANKFHRVVFLNRGDEIGFKVSKGEIVDLVNANAEFLEVFEMVKGENPDKKVMLRELGFGLNGGISREKKLTDVSAFERVCGVHVSMGMKHDIYRKKISEGVNQRFHVDVFPDVERVEIDGEVVFEDEKWVL